jgi:ABC-type transport system involved in Fe-S cluster assembly fused permease/ATPase subunit
MTRLATCNSWFECAKFAIIFGLTAVAVYFGLQYAWREWTVFAFLGVFLYFMGFVRAFSWRTLSQRAFSRLLKKSEGARR